MSDEEDIAMQVRCVHCLCVQYAPAVIAFSLGVDSCVWCDQKSTSMTADEYRAALAFARSQQGKAS